jgi:FkbM family methyltransferase
MAGKIHYYDCYDLRKFKPHDIKAFVDIGANVGTTVIMARILNPQAKVVALEPCKETFDILERNMQYWQTECYNVAFGPGTPMNFVPRSQSGMHRFVDDSDEEKQWWKDTYTIESKTLVQIFEEYKIPTSEPYIIKVDCEGGERFLLEEVEAWNLIRSSVQTMFEIHLSFGGTFDQWNEWFKKFEDTHELRLGHWVDKGTPQRRYVYTPVDQLPSPKGTPQMSLVDRDWVKKRG